MISINKQGNAIVIEFTDNDKYLFNGKIEVAPNELIVVVDQSDMVTFKRASNGDVLFSQLVDDIQIAGSPVTKDTIIDQFAIIGFTSGGGGGAGGAVSSVNGQTGDVIITPASLNVYTRAEVDADINAETTERQKQDSALGGMIAAETAAREQAVASKQDTLVSGTNIKTINGQTLLGEGNIEIQGAADSVEWDNVLSKPDDIVNITERLAAKLDTATYNSEKANFATKDELNSKADTSAIADMATQTWVQGQGYLTEVPSNYVTDSELTEALADKQDKGDYALKSDLNTLATKEELAAKADASALSAKQDTLVSGQNIKTINGESVLGEGNIAIQGGTSNWDDITGKPEFAEVATSGDYDDLTNKPTIPDVSNLATKAEIADMETRTHAAATYATKGEIPSLEGYLTETEASETYATKEDLADYQPVGDYATKAELASKQDTLVSGTNIKTVNGQSLLGNGNIDITGGGTITVDSALSTDSENPVQNKVITNALNGKQDAGDYALKSEIPDTSELATKEELAAKLDTSTYNEEKATFALKSELPDTSTLATKSEVTSGLATKLDVATYNVDKPTFALKTEIPDVSTLATKEELAGKQDALTAGAGIKIADGTIRTVNNVQQAKIIPQSSGFIFNTISVDNAGTPSIVNAQLSNTKDQDIQFEPNSSNPSTPIVYIKLSDNIVRKTVADQTYATKQELGSKLDTATYNSEKAGFETKENAAATYQVKGDYATTAQLNSKQDTLVSGTNIKTINGNSILGEGDITIGGSSVEVDDTLSTTSENPVQNKVITKRLNSIDEGQSVKLGFSSAASTASNSGAVAIGRTADAGSQDNSKYGIAIGAGATTTGNSAIAIGGYGTMAQATYATVIGGQSNSNVEHSVVIGDNISNTTDKVVIGSGENKYISVGQDDKVNIRKSDGSTIAIEDSIMTEAQKSKLNSTPTFWTGTQTEYDSIQDKDENTYYFIKEG